MNTFELEDALRAWLRDDAGAPDTPPPASLAARVEALPDREPSGAPWPWRGSVRRDAWSLILVAALLVAVATTTILAGAALLRVLQNEDDIVSGAIEPCELVTDEDLGQLAGGEWRTLYGFPDQNRYTYSRDWAVPQAAELVLGEATRHCEYAGANHVELFVRATPTTLDEAAALVQTLYGTACTTTGGDPEVDTCDPKRMEFGRATGWVSSLEPDAGHVALALSAAPQFVLITFGLDAGNDEVVMQALAALVIERLEGRALPVKATPRPDQLRVGDQAPELYPGPGDAPLRLEALRGRTVMVLAPPEVGPDNDLAVERFVVPALQWFARAALLAPATADFIVLAEEPYVDWEALMLRAESGGDQLSPTLQLAPLPDDGGFNPLYLLSLAGTEPGPSKLVIVDPTGRVAAIYPWQLPAAEELARIAAELGLAAE